MHDECLTDYESDPDYLYDGFMPGEGEMPERIQKLVEVV
jgi:hypothetical protein